MADPIWTIGGRYCGQMDNGQVYNENRHHVGHVDNGIIFSVRTGRAIGEFCHKDRVGLRTSKGYPIRGIRHTRASRGFGKHGNKSRIGIVGWKESDF